ncbi:MAG: DUF4159 domain-containing protein, partial [Candidatus Korobacteraceae bacterium]
MNLLPRALALLLCLTLGACLFALQFGQRRFTEEESAGSAADLAPTEWAFARLRWYSATSGYYRGWWAMDYPKADRQFTMGMQRLTRLESRSIEHVVDINSDEIYDWPWIYAELAGRWQLTSEQAERLRTYLLRGGFLMVDNMHGDWEWATFAAGIQMVFPDRPIEDLPTSDPIYHVLYDLDERYQVPRISFVGRPYMPDARIPRWRGIRDDQGRVMVA